MAVRGQTISKLYPIFSILLLGASLIGAIFLVKRNQDLRNNAAGSAPNCPSGTVSQRTYGECCACKKAKEVRECTLANGQKEYYSSDCVHDSDGCTNGCSSSPTSTPGQSGCSESFCNAVGNESTCWTHADSGCGWIDGRCTCNKSQPGVTITGNCDSFTVSGGTARLSVAICKDEYYPGKTKSNCQADANKGVGCATQMKEYGPGTHSISPNVSCGIYQVDATGNGWNCAKTGCHWDDAKCTASTPSPTPTLPPSPTPTKTTPAFSCDGLTLNGQNKDITVFLGDTIDLSANVSHYGIISSAKVSSIGGRVADGTDISRLSESSNPSASFTPDKIGVYAVEVNAYDNSQCNYLCSTGKILYENTIGPNRCVTDINDWKNTGKNCTSNNCIHWITVKKPVISNTPPPTPTPTNTPEPSNTPTPTPTSGPTYSCNCTTVKLYDQEWTEILPSDVSAGQTIYISVQGWKDYPVYKIDKGRIRVNKSSWLSSDETTQVVPGRTEEFYITYTIPVDGGSFKVEGEIHLDGPEPGGRWQ